MGNYIDGTEITDWPSTYDATKKAEAIAVAENKVEFYCNRVFYDDKAFDVYIDGEGKSQLWLGWGDDIQTITTFEIGREDPTSLDVSTELMFDKDLVRLTDDSDYETFPKGVKNLHIVGTRGRAAIPQAVIDASIMLVRVNWKPASMTSSMFDRERMADFSVTNRREGRKKNERSTGYVETDLLLNPHVANRAGLMIF